MKKEKKSHFNLWIYVIITICILSSSIAYSALNASVKITGDVVIEKAKLPLYDEIKKNAVMDNIKSNFVSSSTGINFKVISSNTNGKGVYERKGTENQQYPIYYYRGAVDNNNVIFAKYCWKIVRTTETGGIKLIFNGTPSSSNTCNNTGEASLLYTMSFNSSYNSPAYVGYKYGTVYPINSETNIDSPLYGYNVNYSGGKYELSEQCSGLDNECHFFCANSPICSVVRYYSYLSGNGTGYYIELRNGEKIENVLINMLDKSETNSTIKDYIENTWYKGHMTSYSDRLEDTEWCYDRSIYSKGGYDSVGSLTSTLSFEGYNRLENGTPSLECPREVDKFTVGNGRLQYKTGLLTVDEAMLAGGTGNSSSSSYYLYTGKNYWLGSPSDVDSIANGFYVHSTGDLDYSFVNGAYGVRPVVSLKVGINYNDGDGTGNRPYIIE